MMIEVLKSKLHCVRVTEANLNYMGSITIDEDLMDAANMIAGHLTYHKELLFLVSCHSHLFFLYLCKMIMSNKKLR